VERRPVPSAPARVEPNRGRIALTVLEDKVRELM